MVKSCAAYNCTARYKKGSGISFHRFPRDPALCKTWITATKIKNFVPAKHTVLCGKHFSRESFQIRPNASYDLLKDDAVPSLFDFPEGLSTTIEKKRRSIIKTQADKEAQPESEPETDDGSRTSLYSACTTISCEQQALLKKVTKEDRKQQKPNGFSPTKARLHHKAKILQQLLKIRDIKITSMKDAISTLKRLKGSKTLIDIQYLKRFSSVFFTFSFKCCSK